MSSYNRHCRENPRTVYVSEAIVHSSPFANAWLPLVGLTDEFVSLFSVRSLRYAAAAAAFTSTTDPEAQACANHPFAVGGHLCLLTYDSIVNDLFRYLAVRTPPLAPSGASGGPANLAREGAAAARAGPAQDDLTAVLQGLGFDTALLPQTASARPTRSWSTRSTRPCSWCLSTAPGCGWSWSAPPAGGSTRRPR